MNNREDFFTKMRMLLRLGMGLTLNDTDMYLNILGQNQNILDQIISEFNEGQMGCFPPEDDGWNASNGDVIIGDYKIVLCCYGDLSINIYKKDKYIGMFTFNESLDINQRINDIHEEIRVLMAEKRILSEKLKQMA